MAAQGGKQMGAYDYLIKLMLIGDSGQSHSSKRSLSPMFLMALQRIVRFRDAWRILAQSLNCILGNVLSKSQHRWAGVGKSSLLLRFSDDSFGVQNTAALYVHPILRKIVSIVSVYHMS